MQKLTKTTSAEPEIEFKSNTVLRYVKGLSEQVCHCLQQQHGIGAGSSQRLHYNHS